MKNTSVAFVILTKNEGIHLRRCLLSIASVAREIVIVDSHSDDDTCDIAREFGAQVHQRPFRNYADQFQWALDHAGIRSDWIFRLDADEYIDETLREELSGRLAALPADVTGIHFRLKRIFFGKWVRHGGCTLRLLRLWRNGAGRIEQRWMDEHIILGAGRTVTFRGRFSDHNLKDIGYFTEKHNSYATREAIDAIIHRFGLSREFDTLANSELIDGNWIKKFVKERLYYRLPPLLAACSYVIYRYFIRLGFLDGYWGAYYHFLQGAWYRILVAAKVEELSTLIDGASGRAEMISILEKYSGRSLNLD